MALNTGLGFDERGVMFEGFRMLIGAIIALLILIIIVSAVQYFSEEKYRISMHRFYTGIETASAQPNGTAFAIENLTLAPGTAFSEDALARMMGLTDGCVDFDSAGSAFKEGLGTVEVVQSVESTVYVKCETNTLSGSGCTVECIVSFGKPFED